MADIVKFKGNTLPTRALGSKFENALERASSSVEVGSGGLPFLKMGHKTGWWDYGQDDTEVEEGSYWAINPDTLEKGFSYWKDRKSIKRMKNVFDGEVLLSELPPADADDGKGWKETVAFQLQCTHGEDEGTVVQYETNTYGGRTAWKATVQAIRKQARENPTQVVPIIEMLSTSYQHSNPAFGTIYNPHFRIVKWVAYDGQEPDEPEAAVPAESPKGPPPAAAASAATNGAAPRRRAAPAAVTEVEEEVEPTKPAPGPAADPVQRRRRRAAAS